MIKEIVVELWLKKEMKSLMRAPHLIWFCLCCLPIQFTQAAASEDDRLLGVYESATVEEMIQKLDQLIVDFPQSYRAYAFRSMMYLENQAPKRALEDCHTALDLNPIFPYTYVICAQVKAELGDYSGSKAYLIKAEELGDVVEPPTEQEKSTFSPTITAPQR
jgi:predicted Zn-dependent protease